MTIQILWFHWKNSLSDFSSKYGKKSFMWVRSHRANISVVWKAFSSFFYPIAPFFPAGGWKIPKKFLPNWLKISKKLKNFVPFDFHFNLQNADVVYKGTKTISNLTEKSNLIKEWNRFINKSTKIAKKSQQYKTNHDWKCTIQ